MIRLYNVNHYQSVKDDFNKLLLLVFLMSDYVVLITTKCFYVLIAKSIFHCNILKMEYAKVQ